MDNTQPNSEPQWLTQIEERRAKITRPPWIVAPPLCGPDGQGVYQVESMGPICEVGDSYPRGDNRPQENMDFIANAPTDIDKLIAEYKAMKAEREWRPIESAPKDGTQLLLVDENGWRVTGCWGKHDHVPLYGWIRVENENNVTGFEPTHWIPLPKAPDGE